MTNMKPMIALPDLDKFSQRELREYADALRLVAQYVGQAAAVLRYRGKSDQRELAAQRRLGELRAELPGCVRWE